MKNLIYFLVPALIVLSACSKDDDSPKDSETPKNYVSLKSPKDGQQNMYIHYTKICGENGNFSYTGDTLLLSVLETDTGTILTESFTIGSTNYSELEDALYPIESNGAYVLIPQRQASWLFYFYGNDTIHLNRTPNVELTQDNCVLTYLNGQPFIGDEIGTITNFSMGDIALSNKTAISCVPPFMELDAYLIYDENGIAVSSTLDLMMNTVDGWVWVK